MSAEKRRVERTLMEFRALGLLIGTLDPESRQELEDVIRRIPEIHKKELLWSEEQAIRGIERLRADFGAKRPNADYVKVVREAADAPFEMLWVPKHYIEQHWFEHAGRVSKQWEVYPPHTRFGIDAKWLVRTRIHAREWRLLEATLFEDLAMLWNDAYQSRLDDTGKFGDEKIPGKRHRGQVRSAIRAAFALVEG